MSRTASAVRLFRYAGVSCGCGAVAASKLSWNVEKAVFLLLLRPLLPAFLPTSENPTSVYKIIGKENLVQHRAEGYVNYLVRIGSLTCSANSNEINSLPVFSNFLFTVWASG